MTIDLSRSGDCTACGLPTLAHFSIENTFIGCDGARRQCLEPAKAAPVVERRDPLAVPSGWMDSFEAAVFARCPSREAFRKFAARHRIVPAHFGRRVRYAKADVEKAMRTRDTRMTLVKGHTQAR